MVISYLKRTLKYPFIATVFLSAATIAFAEDAPVYDVDNYPPQFDEQSDAPAAQSPAKFEPLQEDIPDVSHLSLDQRVSRLEQQITNMQHTTDAGKLESMQSTLQSLRGQLDELSHQVQQLQKQQKTLYSDLDKRISSKGAPPAADNADADATEVSTDDSGDTTTVTTTKTKPAKAAAPVKPKAEESQPNPAEEQQMYQNAYNLIKAKKYDEAVTTLQKMIQKYPSGQFAANGHYWLGELYGLLGKNDDAVTEFNTVVNNYPDSPKMADSQLKLGLIYAAQFKWSQAKASFKKVINKYPGTGSARLAAEQLKQIKQAGH